MIGYTLSTAAENRGSRFGTGAVMLAVDELDLEGGEQRLGDGVIQARPNAAHGTPQSRPVTAGHGTAEVNSLPRSVTMASTSATNR
jgi:hypothetical protein